MPGRVLPLLSPEFGSSLLAATMIRRCIWKLSSGQAIGRRQGATGTQSPYFLSSRREFSASSPKQPTQKPAPKVETSKSTNNSSKLILGSVVIGAAFVAAYQTGYFKLHLKDDNSSLRTMDLATTKSTGDSKHPADKESYISNVIQSEMTPSAEIFETSESGSASDLKINKEISEAVPIKEEPIPIEESVPYKEEEISISLENSTRSPNENASSSEVSSEQIQSKDNSTTYINPNQVDSRKTEGSVKEKEDLVDTSLHSSKESELKVSDSHKDILAQVQKGSADCEKREGKSLEDSYSLTIDEGSSKDYTKNVEVDAMVSSKDYAKRDEEAMANSDNKIHDTKLVLDFIEAIHAAERKQAESDAYIFTEEKRKMKEKFEKELKDARAREIMYAEEAAILEKELNREKAKAAAKIKSIQEQAEQKLWEELQRKEEEADVQLRKAQDLFKAELAAAIAKEKSSHMERIAEANLHINSLCMAFYARSEEARQTYSVHKLALGTLALEDALSKGLPIRTEVDVLYKSLEGIDRGSLLALALSSLPDDTVNKGIDTPFQLSQKFDYLKGTLRHFSLIPSGGGGLLAHAVAHVASSIKMIEDGSGDTVESLISRIDSFIAEKKYAEAADALEEGVRGTEAEAVAVEWSIRARKRAVVEQALSLLQSYALSITFE